MARDAISRQYDVDKNRVTLTCEEGKGNYRPGIITFYPKAGKTLDLRKMEESIRATRLSGGSSMGVDYLEITALGGVTIDGAAATFKVSGSTQQFVLKEASAKDGEKTPLGRLREALAGGAKIESVTGRVQGWTGTFPVVLRNFAKMPADATQELTVTDFEMKK